MTYLLALFLAFCAALVGFFWWLSLSRPQSRAGLVLMLAGLAALVALFTVWRPS